MILTGARRQDPAEECGRDHDRDAGEEEHRPDRPILVQGSRSAAPSVPSPGRRLRLPDWSG